MNSALHNQALSLPLNERAELAHLLLKSLDDEESVTGESLELEEQIQAQWLEAVARRAQELDSGAVKGIPAEQVFAKARALLA